MRNRTYKYIKILHNMFILIRAHLYVIYIYIYHTGGLSSKYNVNIYNLFDLSHVC